MNCVVVVDCNTGEGLFYSRRIGRSPQLADTFGDEPPPRPPELSVPPRSPAGFPAVFPWAFWTPSPTGRGPRQHHPGAGKQLRSDPRESGLARGTEPRIHRYRDEPFARPIEEPYLHASAYAGSRPAAAICRRFEVSGPSRPESVCRVAPRRSRRHSRIRFTCTSVLTGVDFDSTRTSLTGTNLEMRFAKVGGKRLRFETAYQRRTPGFDINDIGFLRQADQQAWTSWANLAFRTPNWIFRELRWNFNNWEYWTFDGLPTERAFNTNVHTQFNNRWWLHMGGTLGQVGATYCDRCARGGPAIWQDPTSAPGSLSRATTGTVSSLPLGELLEGRSGPLRVH